MLYKGTTRVSLTKYESGKSTYGLSMLQEVEESILKSTYATVGLIDTEEILQDGSIVTPIPDGWTYQPSNLAEYYTTILTEDHIYAEKKLKEVLGNLDS